MSKKAKSNKNISTKSLIILVSFVFLVALIIVSYKKFSSNDDAIAKVQNVIIRGTDFSDYLLKIQQNTQKNIQISDLSEEEKEFIAKQIFVQKKTLELAKKSKIEKDEKVKEAIRKSKDAILREAFLQDIIANDVSEDDLKSEYQRIVANLTGKKEYQLSHIFLSDLTEAKHIRKTLTKENFATKAEKFSQDEISGKKGGSLGFVNEDILNPEIKEVVELLKDGVISMPFATAEGVQIIYRQSSRDVVIPEYEEIKERIRQQKVKEYLKTFYEDLLKDVDVEYLK